MGLGFTALNDMSRINDLLTKTSNEYTLEGQNPIENIFSQNPSTSNFITVLLGRDDDLDGVTDGTFTVSEIIPGLENITSTPKLVREGPGAGRWTALLDSLSVNGKDIPLNSSISGIPNGKSLASLDTGFTTSPVPPFMMNAIYSSMPGAIFSKAYDQWVVPCNSTADVRFTLG